MHVGGKKVIQKSGGTAVDMKSQDDMERIVHFLCKMLFLTYKLCTVGKQFFIFIKNHIKLFDQYCCNIILYYSHFV